MKNNALNYFNNGCSCSESIIKSAIDEGLCPKEFLDASYSFAGGMGSGCLCGAIASVQILLGYIYKKENAKINAQAFITKFKESNGATCCRILSKGLDGIERRHHCSKIVEQCVEIFEEMVQKTSKIS